MSALEQGKVFENQIRGFLRAVGFEEVPDDHEIGRDTRLFLGTQEIDAFGIFEGLYVVVDAKTKISLEHRSSNVQNYLSIINGYRVAVTTAARKRYESRYGFRDIVFIFWTKDVKVENQQQQLSASCRIALRDSFDLDCYEEARRILQNRDIVRNGFLKDISLQLPGLPVSLEGTPLSPSVIRTVFGSKVLYTFPIEVRNLLKFAYVFRIQTNSILGASYQRLLKEDKLIKMRAFIENDGGYFPNNLIAVSEENFSASFTPDQNVPSGASFVPGRISLPDRPCYLEILDGQHRLYCYSSLPNRQGDCLWMTVVEGLNSRDKAGLFVKINKTQTPVPAFLLWDLYRFAEPGSTNAKISELVYRLNELDPLKDLILLPRVRSSKAYLSFPNFCSYLASRTNLYANYGSRRIFKNVLAAYFAAIAGDSELQIDWNRSVENKGKKGFVCTNNSISLLLRLLSKVLGKTGVPPDDGMVQRWQGRLHEWVGVAFNAFLNGNVGVDVDDPYKSLRKLTSEKARKDAASSAWEISPLSADNADIAY